MRLGFRPLANLAADLINAQGEYRLILELTANAGETGTALFTLGESRFRIPGQLHGLLGGITWERTFGPNLSTAPARRS